MGIRKPKKHPKQQVSEKEQMSLDEFMQEHGPCSVDWFYGHKVAAIHQAKPNDNRPGDPVWTIEFDNGGMIYNFDPTIPANNVVGAALTRCDLSVGTTVLNFGLERITLDPIQYAMEHPTYTKGIVVFPQRSTYNTPPRIPAHDDSRAADGAEEHTEDDGA